MKKWFITSLFLAYFLLFSQKSFAKHIVGGELSMQHIEGLRYQFRLFLYLDNNPEDADLQNSWPAYIQQDGEVIVYAYSNRDNRLIDTFSLSRFENAPLVQFNDDCRINRIRSNVFKYRGTYTLDPDKYNDKRGYYLVFQRCCRNQNISNTASQGQDVYGQTFFLEFPPIVNEEGGPFINSTPEFPILENDYACLNNPYFDDLQIFDKDGDELRYSMVTPFDVSNPEIPVPVPGPKPYQELPWGSDFSTNRQIVGPEPLQISQKGILSVTPSKTGLFVYGVKVEEFRNGVKIGEVRRDYQLHVIDCDINNEPPAIKATNLANRDLQANELINVSDPENQCITVSVADPKTPSKLRLQAFGVNFQQNLSNQFKEQELIYDGMNIETEFCFDFCYPDLNEPLKIGLVVFDDSCPTPLSDTLIFTANFPKIENSKPVFHESRKVVESVKLGEKWEYPFVLTDVDKEDKLSVSLEALNFFPDIFELLDIGLDIPDSGSMGDPNDNTIRGKLVFDFTCDKEKFKRLNTLKFNIKGKDDFDCPAHVPTDLEVELNLIFEDEFPAELTTDKDIDVIEITAGESFEANFMLSDQDIGTTVELSVDAPEETDFFLSFPKIEALNKVEQKLSITPSCLQFEGKEALETKFTIVGIATGVCGGFEKLTRDYTLKINPPTNFNPVLATSVLTNETIEVEVGKTFKMQMIGIDDPSDFMKLSLENIDELAGVSYFFEGKNGRGRIEADFILDAKSCDILLGQESREITFDFKLQDDYCLTPGVATKSVTFVIRNKANTHDQFIPPNVFTPNGDSKNPTFKMPLLPKDRCFNEFEVVKIYNRTGVKVYESSSRYFEWNGDKKPAGTYFYELNFTENKYKGYISLVK